MGDSTEHRSRRARAGLLALTMTAALAPVAAQEQPGACALVWVPRDGRLTKEARDQALADLARQEASPQHLVLLVHGWDTPQDQSRKQYAEVAPRVRAEFQRLGERVAILGVQWDSDAGARRAWVPAALGYQLMRLLGFKNAIRDPYTSRIPRARAVGRRALRELCFDAQERFPGVRSHLFIHSMGAEAAIHAVDPGFSTHAGQREEETYLPERPLKLDIVALVGADLDKDAQKRRIVANDARISPPGLLWITLPKVGSQQDRVLKLRKRARGKAALGNSVPQFRGDQMDDLISQRRLIYDTIDIPADHALVHYYSEGRLARLAAAAATLRDPAKGSSALLKELDVVLQAPDRVPAISPHLLGGETSPKIYALWRLERILDGNTSHVDGGYAEKVLRMTLKDPRWLDRERLVTDCQVVRQGFWPPVDVVERVRAEAVKKGRYDPPRDTREFFSH